MIELAAREGLSRQSPHSGHQPDEGPGLLRSPPSFAKRSMVSRPAPLSRGAPASGLVVWAIPPQRLSTLSARSPAAKISTRPGRHLRHRARLGGHSPGHWGE